MPQFEAAICRKRVRDMCIGADYLPVALAAAVLLGLLGIYALEAVLAEELWAMLDRQNCALGNAGVVLSICLVRSGHFVAVGQLK